MVNKPNEIENLYSIYPYPFPPIFSIAISADGTTLRLNLFPKKNEKEPITTTPIQEHLVKRIAELTDLFLQTKKRQGGDRAQNTATVWATILARYELGESLKAIALDLDMPYETVRKYAQTARKAIGALEKVP